MASEHSMGHGQQEQSSGRTAKRSIHCLRICLGLTRVSFSMLNQYQCWYTMTSCGRNRCGIAYEIEACANRPILVEHRRELACPSGFQSDETVMKVKSRHKLWQDDWKAVFKLHRCVSSSSLVVCLDGFRSLCWCSCAR